MIFLKNKRLKYRIIFYSIRKKNNRINDGKFTVINFCISSFYFSFSFIKKFAQYGFSLSNIAFCVSVNLCG